MFIDSSSSSATQAEKEEVDSRSIYVGNVRFYCPLRLVAMSYLKGSSSIVWYFLTDEFLVALFIWIDLFLYYPLFKIHFVAMHILSYTMTF